MNIKPIAERVIIKPNEAEKVRKSGIIIPEIAKERPNQGIIVAVAHDVKLIKVGDTVLYGGYSGQEIEYEGNIYLIMKEFEVFAVI